MPLVGSVVRAGEPDPTAQAMFGQARAELVWLVEDGYVETRAELERANFRLDYRSDQCAVLIGVHLGMSEVNVRIGPRSITWLSGGAVDLLYALKMRGLHRPAALLPNRASVQHLLDWFQGYLDGLAALRRYELAGDWSKYDEAGVAAMRASVAERITKQEQIVQDIVEKVRREREAP
jgi:hypothetical protein